MMKINKDNFSDFLTGYIECIERGTCNGGYCPCYTECNDPRLIREQLIEYAKYGDAGEVLNWHDLSELPTDTEGKYYVTIKVKTGEYKTNIATWDGRNFRGTGNMQGVTAWMRLPGAFQ